jgi:hypothetical protein
LPSEVKSWFGKCPGDADGWESRVDSYLDLNSDDIGIKLREGRLEIKQRSDKFGFLQFHDRVAGSVERWWKIGADLSQIPENDKLLFDTRSGWIAVGKERKLKIYRSEDFVSESTKDNPEDGHMPSDNELELGCTFEIANIHLMGQEWWSLAFEAYGESGAAYRLLLNVIKLLSETQETPALSASESFSYPHWLSLVGSA